MGFVHENPRKPPPGVIETDPPDEESRYGRELGTNAKVTWSWLKSRFKGFSPEPDHDRDYWNGKWGRLYIEVRPFTAEGKWIEGLYQEFTADALRAAQDYGFGLMRDMPEVDGFWIETVVDKYWTLKGERRWMRVMTLGRYERAGGAAMAPNASLRLIDPQVDDTKTRQLRAARLRSRTDGSFNESMLVAGKNAQGHRKSVYVYQGNSFMHLVWRVTLKRSEVTSSINNTGSTVFEVSPDLSVTQWTVERGQHSSDEQTPNSSSYYVWVVAHDGTPLTSEGPYGPHPLEKAKQLARIGATEGVHDRVVSLGRSPTSPSFKIERRYRKGTGERVI